MSEESIHNEPIRLYDEFSVMTTEGRKLYDEIDNDVKAILNKYQFHNSVELEHMMLTTVTHNMSENRLLKAMMRKRKRRGECNSHFQSLLDRTKE